MSVPASNPRSPTWLLGRRYRLIEPIGAGGMGTVFRAEDRLGGQVALKLIAGYWGWKPRDPTRTSDDTNRPQTYETDPNATRGRTTGSSSAGDTLGSGDTLLASGDLTLQAAAQSPDGEMRPTLRAALTHEFQHLATLRHPNIIGVRDYGFDEAAMPYYTMELLDDAESLLDAAQRLSLDERIALFGQLLRGVLFLHRRGIVHRDLKPGNVLVSGGRVRVLDFGLATLLEKRDSYDFSGTPGYMAPELLASGAPSRASDLYAVGVIAYQVFGSRSPWKGVARPTIDWDPIDPRLVPVIKKLLAKTPEARFDDAGDVIAALVAATGVPLVSETADTRESRLRWAPLIGREAELARFTAPLEKLIDSGQGGGWLLGGESGVGKSRLLDELRARALVAGATVVVGQAVNEGGGPYVLWRELLRWLAILTDPSDDEASAIAPLVPDLAALLGRPVAPAGELPPDAARTRLHSAIEALLARLDRPLVLLLEDLQWAQSDSLQLLARVGQIAGKLRLLVIATYRHDEAPGLRQQLAALETVQLERLSAPDIARLAEAMIESAGPELLELLQRETEGNPFFLVEVVRALAEEAGEIDRVGAAPLPRTVQARGLKQLLDRRLERVGTEARALLACAAVIGRQIDTALLLAMAPPELRPEPRIDEWLLVCTNASVLSAHERGARFAHDKLREAVLAALPDDERRELHRRVAEAIERLGRGDLGETAALAHHFRHAGVDAKAAHYTGLAGEEAVRSSACAEAVELFKLALSLAPDDKSDGVGAQRAHWLGLLGEAYGGLGDQVQGSAYGKAALRQLRLRVPESTARFAVELLGELIIRAWRSLFPERRVSQAAERARLGSATRLHNYLSESFFFQEQPLAMIWSGLRALNLGERGGDAPDLSRAYSAMGVLVGSLSLHSLARRWARRAVELAEMGGRDRELAMAAHREGLHFLTTCNWAGARADLERGCAIFARVGARREWEETTGVLGLHWAYQGHFREAMPLFDGLHQSAVPRADKQSVVWGLQLGGYNRMRLGETEAGEAQLNESLQWFDMATTSTDVVNAHGPLALAALRLGDRARAVRHAEQALEVLERKRLIAYWIHHSLGALAETVLTLWESEPASGAAALAVMSARTCKIIRVFAGTFPIGRPATLLWQSWYASLAGHPTRARVAGLRALAAARRKGMLYDEARAQLELGRRARGQERATRLQRAAELFEQMGTPSELALTRSLAEG